jgi:hypothetical protein
MHRGDGLSDMLLAFACLNRGLKRDLFSLLRVLRSGPNSHCDLVYRGSRLPARRRQCGRPIGQIRRVIAERLAAGCEVTGNFSHTQDDPAELSGHPVHRAPNAPEIALTDRIRRDS